MWCPEPVKARPPQHGLLFMLCMPSGTPAYNAGDGVRFLNRASREKRHLFMPEWWNGRHGGLKIRCPRA